MNSIWTKQIFDIHDCSRFPGREITSKRTQRIEFHDGHNRELGAQKKSQLLRALVSLVAAVIMVPTVISRSMASVIYLSSEWLRFVVIRSS